MSVAISVSCKRAVVPFRELRLSPSGGNEATASSRTQHGGRGAATAASTSSNIAPVLSDCLPRAGANRLAVDGDLDQLYQSFADQRHHALRQEPIEDLDAFDPEVGKPVVVQRHASRQPSIGRVALRKPLQFARPNPPFDRGIKPQRHENRRIGGRWSGVPRTRASNQGRPVLGGVRATPAMSASTTCLAISVAPPGPRMQLKRHAAQPVEPSLAMPAHSV